MELFLKLKFVSNVGENEIIMLFGCLQVSHSYHSSLTFVEKKSYHSYESTCSLTSEFDINASRYLYFGILI